jgi:hypothetical protein
MLQEKFEITVPNRKEEGGAWVSFESARETQGIDTTCFNDMPPGMDISAQHGTQQPSMPFSLAGVTDVSCEDASAKALTEGFSTKKMKGCDDQYTGEHVDHFYGDAGGFAERNNYLDRL